MIQLQSSIVLLNFTAHTDTNLGFISSNDDEHSSERVVIRDLIDSQNSPGTTSTELSSENELNLCMPCTNERVLHLEGTNMVAADKITNFVDV